MTNQNQTTSLVKAPAAGAIAKWDATPEQVQLLKNTIAKGTSDDEFALFMTVAKHMELNPFLRQIHAVRRWDPEQERMVMQIQTGIDGYRLMAERSGVYGGQEGPWWCGDDGQWVDVWLAKVAPAAAKVVVHRTDKPRPFTAIALWAEYAQTKKDGTLTAMWRKRGPGQLAKCAEALAFRRAFPIEIGGGAHVDAELDDGDFESAKDANPQFVAPPPPQGPPPGVPQGAQFVETPTGPKLVTVTDTGTKPTEPKRGPGRPPGSKNAERPTAPAAGSSKESSPPATAPQQTASNGNSATSPTSSPTSTSPSAAGESSADPTAGAAPSTAVPTPALSSAATSSPDAGPSLESSSTPTDDGFGGEDPEDSQPTPTGDPGLSLIAEFRAFLAGCKDQKEMLAGRPPFAQRSAALFKEGDARFAAPGNGKPAGELAQRMGQLWAERKAQLPV